MTWLGIIPPPEGFERALIQEGDTLARFEDELGMSALDIAEANGVPNPGVKTCAWARDIAAWVLGTGGRRFPPSRIQPNECEPGKGHVAFRPGQVINLPLGAREPAPVVETGRPILPGAPAPTQRAGLGMGALVGGGLLLLLLAGGDRKKKRRRRRR